MMKNECIFVINTGNSSTKVALYQGKTGLHAPADVLYEESLRHSEEELASAGTLFGQEQFRREAIQNWLVGKNIDPGTITAAAVRGGLLKPLDGGTYLVNETMLKDLREAKRGVHASHLSAILGSGFAGEWGIPCYTVDPVSVDEYWALARYSGHPLFTRAALSHALNMKAVARRYAEESGRSYEELTVITVHLGSGISVSIHHNGRMVDGIDSSQEGCFSIDRCGGLPVRNAVKYLFENNLDYSEFSKMVFGRGGLSAYVGTKDFFIIAEGYLNGDPKYREPVDAMIYQAAKEVGALAAAVRGKVDRIILTGGMAREDFLTEALSDHVSFISPVSVYPGEDEMRALAEGVLRARSGEVPVKIYE